MQRRVKAAAVRTWLWLDARDKCPCHVVGSVLRRCKLDDTGPGVELRCIAIQICATMVKWHDDVSDEEVA